MDLKSKIREIPDFPRKGINFKDITPLLEDAEGFQEVIDQLAAPYLKKEIDKVVGIDARGFILAAAVAYKLKVGLAVVRKKGKLPSKTVSREYTLEYASNTIEMHEDAIKPGERVLIIDDVLATGGTAKASADIIEKLRGRIVSLVFLTELAFLNGRERLKGYEVYSLIKY